MNLARKSLAAMLLTIALLLTVASHHASSAPLAEACPATAHHCDAQSRDMPCCPSGICVAGLVAEEPTSFPTVATAPRRHANAGLRYWPPFIIDRPPKG